MSYKFQLWHLAIFAISIYLIYLSHVGSFMGAAINLPFAVQGDADGDGVVSVLDESLAQLMYSGQIPSDISLDMDGDSVIGPGDIVKIQQAIVSSDDNVSFVGLPCLLPGDVNRNGFLDVYDVELTQLQYVETLPPDSCADIDGDGYPGPGDINREQLLVAGGSYLNYSQSIYDKFILMNCSLVGDINRDGKIDIDDLKIMRFELFDVVKDDLCGDVTGDGVITIEDFDGLKDLIETPVVNETAEEPVPSGGGGGGGAPVINCDENEELVDGACQTQIIDVAKVKEPVNWWLLLLGVSLPLITVWRPGK